MTDTTQPIRDRIAALVELGDARRTPRQSAELLELAAMLQEPPRVGAGAL